MQQPQVSKSCIARRLAFIVLGLAPFISTPTLAESASEKPAGIPASLVQIGRTASYYSPYALVVDKKARTLTVWTHDQSGYKRVTEVPADLGKLEGDKRSSGDHRTPEGVYFIVDRLEGPGLDFSQYGKRAFPTDYPNFFDRLAGKTGHGIWLHAVPDNVPLTRGSRGCVVVRNDIIQSLTPYITIGKTPILIEPEVTYESSDDLKSDSDDVINVLEQWRTAWETKNIESYIGYYDDSFRSQKMDRSAWKQFKKGLNEKYQSLSVQISKPLILRYKEHLVARFIQAYRSDQHQDFGEKTLYLRKTANGYKILGEDWAPDESQLAKAELQPAHADSATTATAACGAGAGAASGVDCAPKTATAN